MWFSSFSFLFLVGFEQIWNVWIDRECYENEWRKRWWNAFGIGPVYCPKHSWTKKSQRSASTFVIVEKCSESISQQNQIVSRTVFFLSRIFIWRVIFHDDNRVVDEHPERENERKKRDFIDIITCDISDDKSDDSTSGTECTRKCILEPRKIGIKRGLWPY